MCERGGSMASATSRGPRCATGGRWTRVRHGETVRVSVDGGAGERCAAWHDSRLAGDRAETGTRSLRGRRSRGRCRRPAWPVAAGALPSRTTRPRGPRPARGGGGRTQPPRTFSGTTDVSGLPVRPGLQCTVVLPPNPSRCRSERWPARTAPVVVVSVRCVLPARSSRCWPPVWQAAFGGLVAQR